MAESEFAEWKDEQNLRKLEK